jgi:hypothetical protein
LISSAHGYFAPGNLSTVSAGSSVLIANEPGPDSEDAAVLAQREPARRFLNSEDPVASLSVLTQLADAALHHERWLLRSAPAAMAQRVSWFERLLVSLDADDREAWVGQEIRRGQAHPMAATSLLARLEPLLDRTSVPVAQRCRLQALWLAVAATGPIRLDPHLRDEELRQAAALLNVWLASARLT